MALGLARTGSVAGNGSGDIFIAFSTANAAAASESRKVVPVEMLPNDQMGPLFEATVGATEEAIVNALVAGRTMTGRGGNTVLGMPHDRVREILKRHGMLGEPAGR
jgi:L-aminopeptidase/D-esterase-like protein